MLGVSKLHRSPQAQLAPASAWSVRSYSMETSTDPCVAIHSIAVYIHDQINGTFEDIFDRLFYILDLLEYPNNGSVTKVTLADAKLMIEEIGACPESLEEFLEQDADTEKSIDFVQCSAGDVSGSKPSRHPRHARSGAGVHNMAEIADKSDDVATDELLRRAQRNAEGIWFKKTAIGYMVYSRTATMPLTLQYMKKHPIDSEFNVWYKTHMSEGFKPCAGKCAGARPPEWYNVLEEDPPTIDKELQRIGCIGYCRTARRRINS